MATYLDEQIRALELRAGSLLAGWDALTAGDEKKRKPDQWIRDGDAYLAQHPDDLATRRKLSEFKVREARAWGAFDQILRQLEELYPREEYY